jgi:hypothetical protein
MDELLPIDGYEHDHTSSQFRVNFNGMVTLRPGITYFFRAQLVMNAYFYVVDCGVKKNMTLLKLNSIKNIHQNIIRF